MHSIALSASPEQLLRLHELSETDLALVRKFGALVRPKMQAYVDNFYPWIRELPEYQSLFSDHATMIRAQTAQVGYWHSLFAAQVDEAYLAERRRIGEMHARIGLSLPSYFAAMNYSLILFTQHLYDGGMAPEEFSHAISATTKLMHLDTTVVVDTYNTLVNERIAEQGRALMELSTPVTMIWQDILMLPVVGIIDSKRAQDIMAAILGKIGETRARVFIMDISGVAVVDSAVANHLIKITKATRLMGCTSLVSGVSPAIAQTIVHLGINVDEIRTTATLRDALEQAFRSVGISMQKLA